MQRYRRGRRCYYYKSSEDRGAGVEQQTEMRCLVTQALYVKFSDQNSADKITRDNSFQKYRQPNKMSIFFSVFSKSRLSIFIEYFPDDIVGKLVPIFIFEKRYYCCCNSALQRIGGHVTSIHCLEEHHIADNLSVCVRDA